MTLRFTLSALVCFLLLGNSAFAQSSLPTHVWQRLHPTLAAKTKTPLAHVTAYGPYNISINSSKVGQPAYLTKEVVPSGGSAWQLQFAAVPTFGAANIPTQVLYFDNDTSIALPVERQTNTFVGNKISTTVWEAKVPTGWQVNQKDFYYYDSHDSLLLSRTFAVDALGVETLTDYTGRSYVYDAQSRVTSWIDSSLTSQGPKPNAKTEYTYTGSQTTPNRLTFSSYDSTTQAWTASFRINTIVWHNYLRFELVSANLQFPLIGTAFVTIGQFRGVQVGNQYQQTVSTRNSLTGPFTPNTRLTTEFNSVGDFILNKQESYDTTTAQFVISNLDSTVNTYARANGNLSKQINYQYDSQLQAVVGKEKYTLMDTPMAIQKPKASILSLYPNPAAQQAQVQGKPMQTGQLVSATGQGVKTFTLGQTGAATLSLTGLPKGVYYVHVGQEPGQRLVVE